MSRIVQSSGKDAGAFAQEATMPISYAIYTNMLNGRRDRTKVGPSGSLKSRRKGKSGHGGRGNRHG